MPGATLRGIWDTPAMWHRDFPVISYWAPDTKRFRAENEPEGKKERNMLHRSLIAAALALATVSSSAMPGNAETATVRHRTVVHHVYTYEPAPNPH